MMQLYPAIDLKDGQCVRLMQGDYNEVTVYGTHPAEMAQKWESQGATYLHLVDLDGAKAGHGVNEAAIREIVASINIPTELGGGIRSLEDIEKVLGFGVSRVILGSAAVRDKELVRRAIETYGPQRIVVGVDAKGGQVAIEGWLEVTDFTALEFCKELKKLGVQTVIYTDIAKDGMMSGPNLKETQQLAECTGLEIVASGGVSSMQDLEEIERIGVHGAIIGKALYLDAISLPDAVARFETGGETSYAK
ncbi:MAG: 1-(5-phosphoribosyl)-5-[(5-phosphoribosylamino)methylideneamino]imidazole-4-carboxamide isomerase [Cellulosilyticaceae bacterium]